MKKPIGKLIKDKIIIKGSKNIGRFYNKSHFGKIIDNELILNLIEGVFLFEEEKIKLLHDNKEINFVYLLKKSIIKIPNFEIKYIIYRDLRKKGYSLRILDDDKYFDFVILKNKNTNDDKEMKYFISVFSERDIIDIKKYKILIKKASEKKGVLWLSIVDEEGDITYYDISMIDLNGEIIEKDYSKIDSIMLDSRVFITDHRISKKLFEEEFYGKPFGKGLQISMVESLYLLKKGVLRLQTSSNSKKINFKLFKNLVKLIQPDIDLRFNVYNDLKKRGMIVKTGFKFGTHFRVYSKKPHITHAEYLIHLVDKNFKSIWSDFSRGIRLAHSVNKEFIFAVHYNHKNIEYVKLGRLRP